LLALRPTPTWKTILVGYPPLLIQYIRSYSPHLEAVSSIRNRRTRHAVVTGTHITRKKLIIVNAYCATIKSSIIYSVHCIWLQNTKEKSALWL